MSSNENGINAGGNVGKLSDFVEDKANLDKESLYDVTNDIGRLLIMYGSQTGVAESIAKGLHEKIVLANTSGSLETVIVECNRYKRTGLKNGIFDENGSSLYVPSTTGNADAPDNCERFWRYIKRRSHPADLFKGLEYCVLGLGDTNYDKFCYMGEMIDKRLSELGARRFYHLGRADDAVGLDSVVEPWIEGLLKTLNLSNSDGELGKSSKKEVLSIDEEMHETKNQALLGAESKDMEYCDPNINFVPFNRKIAR